MPPTSTPSLYAIRLLLLSSPRPARTCRRGRPVPAAARPSTPSSHSATRDQRVEVDARLDTLAVEQVDEILGADVAGRARRERAAADAADRRVEHGRARLQRRVRVREAGVARVVQVHPDGAPSGAAALPTSSLHLPRNRRRRPCRRTRSRRRPHSRRAVREREHVRRDRRRPRRGSRTRRRSSRSRGCRPRARARRSRAAAASDSSGEAFWLRRLNVSVAAKAKCTSSSPVARRRS